MPFACSGSRRNFIFGTHLLLRVIRILLLIIFSLGPDPSDHGKAVDPMTLHARPGEFRIRMGYCYERNGGKSGEFPTTLNKSHVPAARRLQ
jgi:hypothetical protein